jgi:hypothetical protein
LYQTTSTCISRILLATRMERGSSLFSGWKAVLVFVWSAIQPASI